MRIPSEAATILPPLVAANCPQIASLLGDVASGRYCEISDSDSEFSYRETNRQAILRERPNGEVESVLLRCVQG